jgi:acetate kinase
MFARRAAAAIASAATALPRVDAIVFTGGIGENAGAIRAGIVARLGPLGLAADDVLSIAALEPGGTFARPDRPSLAVVAAREDLVIAGQVAAVLG